MGNINQIRERYLEISTTLVLVKTFCLRDSIPPVIKLDLDCRFTFSQKLCVFNPLPLQVAAEASKEPLTRKTSATPNMVKFISSVQSRGKSEMTLQEPEIEK